MLLALAAAGGLCAADKDLIPPQLPKPQQDNLLRFLQQHERPDRFVPPGARVVSTQPGAQPPAAEVPPGQAIKQYTVQITPHRPVPGQEQVREADVYYYRPNPEKGKPGITVKHTVDLTTGNQVGETEVLLNQHTPISREETAEAVGLAKQKSPDVQALYQGREAGAVRWEYLQMMVSRKTEQADPGDRVLRIVFTAAPAEGQPPPVPVRVLVNLTKETVVKDDR
jgi:hypothetical protein